MKFEVKIPLRAFVASALIVAFLRLPVNSAERFVVGELFTNFS